MTTTDIRTTPQAPSGAVARVQVATIQIVIPAMGEAESADYVAETLREVPGILDWQYLRVGGQYLYPTGARGEFEDGEFVEGSAF